MQREGHTMLRPGQPLGAARRSAVEPSGGHAAQRELPVALAHLERRVRRGPGAPLDRPVAQVERRPVAPADDVLAVDLTELTEGAAAVRAAVVDGEDAVAVAQHELRGLVDDDARGAARLQL